MVKLTTFYIPSVPVPEGYDWDSGYSYDPYCHDSRPLPGWYWNVYDGPNDVEPVSDGPFDNEKDAYVAGSEYRAEVVGKKMKKIFNNKKG